jgi:beta-lactamase regulating signal transducer with metallopeptidase domain
VAHAIETAPRETLAEPIGRRGAYGFSVPAPAETSVPVPKPAAPFVAPQVRPRAPGGVSSDPEFTNDRGSMAAVPPEPRLQPAAAGGAWRQWMVQLGAIRDAVMSLPPIPARVWLGGIVALLLVGVLRVERSRRVVRAARSAPPSVDRMVAEASRELGLRRPPVTLMVDLAVSPMLWCGRRVRLVLPRPLWAQLDDVSRRAVICHELAHLRRRDHWVCRAEMIVGWVYWWHPVVWWVRRRLREEADLSCDAWVTALWPHDRRAYAQALLETRRCSNTDFPAVPSVGLGATTTRARRFARRLTMVMTVQNSPRMSRKGVVLAGVLAMGGVLVTPIWACPEADKDPCETSKPAKAPKADKKKMVLVVPPEPARPPKAPRPPKPPKAPQADTTFERFMLGQEGETKSVEQRIKGLERQLELLHKELQKILHDMPESGAVPPRRGVSQAPMGRGVPGWEARGGSGGGLGAYAAPGPDTGYSPGHSGACLRGGGPCAGGEVIRTYKLPKGKLEALTELMIRSDVPIRVRPGESEIEVHGTAAEHCVFDAFCAMVNGKDQKKTYKLSEGKLKALTEFMVRSDVPILVEAGKQGITVHGTDLEQIVFGAFVRMIQPGAGGEAQATAGGDSAHAYAKALADLAHQYESHAVSQMAEMSSMEAALRAYEQQAKAFEKQADKMQREADRFEDKADQLEDDAEELFDDAENARGQKRNEMLVKAEALMHKAEALRVQAEALEAQAEELEAQAEELEDHAEAIEDEMEELEELAEAEED